ncbi:DnaD domain protein [Enterococcus sp. DIV0800]|uniref:DnaD domain protein n=1 Tax=unclassified Enterococcus TaxID=2608891 RepID=UPI003D2FD05C
MERDEIKTIPGYYSIIPASVRYDKRLSGHAKLLYGEITALCNEKGYCWAGDKYFAGLYNVTKSTIQNWLKSLNDLGYIQKEIVYKKESKEIDFRMIRICDPGMQPTPKNNYKQEKDPIQNNLNTPSQNNLSTYPKNFVNPMQKNLRDNNTFNNTLNKGSSGKAEMTPFKMYESTWGVLNSITIQDLEYWINDLGQELVCEAIKRAALDKASYKYATKIMQRWDKEGYKTLSDVEKDDDEFYDKLTRQKEKTLRRQNKGVSRKEELPDHISNPIIAKKLDPELEQRLNQKLSAYLADPTKKASHD